MELLHSSAKKNDDFNDHTFEIPSLGCLKDKPDVFLTNGKYSENEKHDYKLPTQLYIPLMSLKPETANKLKRIKVMTRTKVSNKQNFLKLVTFLLTPTNKQTNKQKNEIEIKKLIYLVRLTLNA